MQRSFCLFRIAWFESVNERQGVWVSRPKRPEARGNVDAYANLDGAELLTEQIHTRLTLTAPRFGDCRGAVSFQLFADPWPMEHDMPDLRGAVRAVSSSLGGFRNVQALFKMLDEGRFARRQFGCMLWHVGPPNQALLPLGVGSPRGASFASLARVRRRFASL